MHRASRKTRLQRPEGACISYDTLRTLCLLGNEVFWLFILLFYFFEEHTAHLDTGPRISKDPGVRRPKILYVEPELQGGALLMWSEAAGISVDYILPTLAVLRHNLPGVGLIWNRKDVGTPGVPTVGCGDTLRKEC